MRKVVHVFVGVMLAAGVVGAQYPVTNPGFDIDLSGWGSFGGEAAWDSLDANGSPGSGSARLSSGAVPFEEATLSQCIPVVEFEKYVFGVKTLVPDGQAAEVRAHFRVAWYFYPGCTVLLKAEGFDATPWSAGNWYSIFYSNISPQGATSAIIELQGGTFSVIDPAFEVYFDDIWADLEIFSDGFELGNTIRWSSSVP